MAVVTRYFGTSSSGDGDGSTWADRAALFAGGAWSSIITAFSFSGGDSLLCLIGPGTHAITASLASASFSSAPTVANPICFHGCDALGVPLSPARADWTADQAVDWDGNLPVLATTGNILTIQQIHAVYRLLKFTASGVGNAVTTGGTYAAYDWCVVTNSCDNASAYCISANRVTNCALECSGNNYRGVLLLGTTGKADNVRVRGAAGTGGSREGVFLPTTSAWNVWISRLCLVGVGGVGINLYSLSSTCAALLRRCTLVGCGGTGLAGHTTGLGTGGSLASGLVIAGSGGYGVDGGNGTLLVVNSRLRNNTSGNFTNMGNQPVGLDNIESAGTDAAEFVDAVNGDYRIKYGSSLWGKGLGVSDQPGGGAARLIGSSLIGSGM